MTLEASKNIGFLSVPLEQVHLPQRASQTACVKVLYEGKILVNALVVAIIPGELRIYSSGMLLILEWVE